MKKEKKIKKRAFEKRMIYFVFFSVLIVFLLVMTGFVYRIVNVEKQNPVRVSKDFEYLTYDGSYFYRIDKTPEHLTVVEMRWLDGAFREGESRFNQVFRERLIYARYVDADGHRYIWVKDGNFYRENYQWAFWEYDYAQFDQFENSYFYKER